MSIATTGKPLSASHFEGTRPESRSPDATVGPQSVRHQIEADREHERSDEDRPRVLIVDRDPQTAEKVARMLRAFEVYHVGNGAAALTELSEGKAYGVLVIAWNLPNMTAMQLLAELDKKGVNIPAIILIDDYCVLYEETALTLGAADVVAKSRGARILSQRIILLADGVRHPLPQKDPDESLDYGSLTLKVKSCRAFWRGRQVPLTLTEYNIVSLMVRNVPRCQTYREIYDVVHGKGFFAGDGSDGYRLNVRTLIKRIRKKFCVLDAEFDQIETCPGTGYRWREVEV